MSRRRGRFVSLLCVVTLLVASAFAAAAGDERAQAEALLKEVDASPKKAVATELTNNARAALDRAAKLRTNGEEAHAKIADALARTWAEAARDVVRAAAVEESAAQARRDATDAGAISDRERALLEEAVAQAGRLRAQLETNGKDVKTETPARTSAAANSDAGTKTTPKPKDGGAPAASDKPKEAAKDAGAPAPAKPAAKDGGTK